MQKEQDIIFMKRALQLAELGGAFVAPNPKVGAVIVVGNKVIGEGYHKEYGMPHAEVNAINNVSDKTLLSDATIYVTLEPCSHFGKTAPCADLIIQYRFKRVVVACTDSNQKVSGKGIERIRAAGINLEIGILEKQSRDLNKRFFTFHEQKRPFVILKWAETRDGFMDRLPKKRTEGVNWITDRKLKPYVHLWRSEEQAIMVGWKTINNDDPKLNVRKVTGPSPHCFIIDAHGRSNLKAQIFSDGSPTTVLTLKTTQWPKEIDCIRLNEVNVKTILAALYQCNIISVFIEGGAKTIQTFVDTDLWDETYQIIGNTAFVVGLKAPLLKNKYLISTRKVGKDLVMHFRHACVK